MPKPRTKKTTNGASPGRSVAVIPNSGDAYLIRDGELFTSPNAQGGYLNPNEVDHPKHLIAPSGLEVIDVIEGFGLTFHTGNAVKYILRAGNKPGNDPEVDLEKAIWYLRRALHVSRMASK